MFLKQRWLAGLLALAAVNPVVAEERLFTGQVQSVTLQPSGVGQCERPCPPVPEAKDGIRMVCISNMGGCQKALVKVLVDHLGSGQGMVLEFPSRTGEWGELNFPVTEEPILVYERDGHASWTPLVERAGRMYVRLKKHGRRAAFPHLDSLLKHADDEVPLAELLARFGARAAATDQATPLRPNSR